MSGTIFSNNKVIYAQETHWFGHTFNNSYKMDIDNLWIRSYNIIIK